MVVAAGGAKHLRYYPFFKKRREPTIFDFLQFVIPVLRYLGLLPLKKMQENGTVRYISYLGVLYSLQILCECTLVIYLTVTLTQNLSGQVTSPYSFYALELFACFMFAAHIIVTKVKTIEYRKDCEESLDGLYEVDTHFKKLGINTSYNYWILTSKILTLLACVIYPSLLVFAFRNQGHFIALLLQIWRLPSINMFSIFMLLLYSKYKKLNKFLKLYIKENEEGIPLTQISLEPLEVINAVADVYDKLCVGGKNWNNMHNTALGVNLLLYSIGATLFSIAYYTNSREMASMIPVCVFLFIEFFYILTVSQITTIERNSFLLQTLHQKVDFTVMQVFPLDYSIAIKIGGIVLSVLVLHIQIRSLEESQ